MTPLTKLELDLTSAGGCQHPNCKDPNCGGPLFLHPRCHPGRGVEASYANGSGIVKIACRVCHKPIINVKVAEA